MAEIVTAKLEDSAEKAFASAVEALGAETAVAQTTAEPVQPAVKAPQAKTATPNVRKPRTAKPAAATPAVKAKPAKAVAHKARKTASKSQTVPKIKESKMATKQAPDFTDDLKDFVADAQKQAKTAYAKSGALLNEAGAFAKGNVEALVESGKILAAGVQSLGKAYVAETKTAVETATGDVKALAAVRSPADLIKLQGEILRRNTETAFAFGSKNAEALTKLANDVFAPISGRVSLAVEKIKKAA